jgi:hypothetical protein
MSEISINTPALLFPAITLLMLAYTNRFLSIASLVRKLHMEYANGQRTTGIIGQLRNLRARLNLIKYMQGLGVLSFLSCVICMFAIYRGWIILSNWIFAGSLLFLVISIILSLIEIYKSTRALEIILADIEELSGGNIFTDMFPQSKD